MQKFNGYPIRTAEGDVILLVSGNVVRAVRGVSQETEALLPNEQIPQNALLYLTKEDFKLILGGRTYRFMHRNGNRITLIPPKNGGAELELDSETVERVLDMEAQWKVIQECNMIESKPRALVKEGTPVSVMRASSMPSAISSTRTTATSAS